MLASLGGISCSICLYLLKRQTASGFAVCLSCNAYALCTCSLPRTGTPLFQFHLENTKYPVTGFSGFLNMLTLSAWHLLPLSSQLHQGTKARTKQN